MNEPNFSIADFGGDIKIVDDGNPGIPNRELAVVDDGSADNPFHNVAAMAFAREVETKLNAHPRLLRALEEIRAMIEADHPVWRTANAAILAYNPKP